MDTTIVIDVPARNKRILQATYLTLPLPLPLTLGKKKGQAPMMAGAGQAVISGMQGPGGPLETRVDLSPSTSLDHPVSDVGAEGEVGNRYSDTSYPECLP